MIRGEVLMTKQNFAKYNEHLVSEGLPPLANPRNAASGSLRIKDPKIVRKRGLEGIFYHVSEYKKLAGTKLTPLLNTHSGTLEMLWALGFKTPVKQKKVIEGIQGVVNFCHQFETLREELPYEIDGMVIKVNKIELQQRMGSTTHHPRWAMAWQAQIGAPRAAPKRRNAAGTTSFSPSGTTGAGSPSTSVRRTGR